MKGNRNKILIWILTWAVLFLVVIYSPIGSPELYRQNNYSSYNQVVNFSGGIANAPKRHVVQQYEETELAVPVYTREHKSYAVNTVVKPTGYNHQAVYAVTSPANNRKVTNQISARSGGGFTFAGSRGKSAQETSTRSNVEVTSISSDLAMAEDPVTNRQLATADEMSGGTDPGDTPIGPPIPVGEGLLALFLMAGGYALFKRITRI